MPPGSCTMPMLHALLGRHVGDVAAVEPDDAALGHLEAADARAGSSTCRRRSCRAARRISPWWISKLTSKSTCTGPYEKSMFDDLQHRRARALRSRRLRCSSCSSSSSSTTSERSWRMKRAPFMSSRPPMMLVGTPRMITAPRTPIAFVKKSARIAAGEPADEHDVHHAHRDAEPAQAVRAHGLQHRRDHRERARGEHGLRDAPDHEPHAAVRRHLQRREDRRRQDQQRRRAPAPCAGFLRYVRSK